jgi:nicotinate-nucleotide adenylyltransferase
MGSDTFLDLPTWRMPERLGIFATLGVGYRAGSTFDPDGPAAQAVLRRLGRTGWRRVPPDAAEALAPGECALVETRSIPVAARGVRRRLAAGESGEGQVPPAVAAYIADHGLYREPV